MHDRGSISDLQQQLAAQQYIADRGLAVSLFLALRLGRPLFLEGEAGVGKTALAGAVAAALDADLIRLQCYEGLDVTHAVYEWDYARQLLELRILEATRDARPRERASRAVQRSLSDQAAAAAGDRPGPSASAPCSSSTRSIVPTRSSKDICWSCSRSSRSRYPSSAPCALQRRLLVILTSNRTREVHDALKRRCLYQWIGYPDFEKELAIVTREVPHASARLAAQVTALVQELRAHGAVQGARRVRDARLDGGARGPRPRALDPDTIENTLGVVLKSKDDIEALRGEPLAGCSSGATAQRHDLITTCHPHLLNNLLVFGRLLRRLGLDVHVGRMLDVTEALQHVDLGNRDDVYHTCRTLLVHRHDDLAIFDRAFEAFWRQGDARVDEAAARGPVRPRRRTPPDTAQSHRNQGFWDARRLPPAAEEAVEHESEDATAGRCPGLE